MAAEVVWLDDAKDDVRSILRYIDGENPLAAATYVAGLTEACRNLADYPLSGRRYNSNFRCIVFRNHLVFYRFEERFTQVSIVAVVDGRRDIRNIVGEED